MSSDSAEECSLAATRMRWTSSWRQSSGRSVTLPIAPASTLSPSTARPTRVMEGSWRTLSMTRSAVVPEPTTSTRVVVSVRKKKRRTMRPTVMTPMATMTAMTSWVA